MFLSRQESSRFVIANIAYGVAVDPFRLFSRKQQQRFVFHHFVPRGRFVEIPRVHLRIDDGLKRVFLGNIDVGCGAKQERVSTTNTLHSYVFVRRFLLPIFYTIDAGEMVVFLPPFLQLVVENTCTRQ